jgi:MFS family permease
VPRDFYLYLVGRFASGTALTMLRTVVGWHIYSISHSAFHLGLVGVVQFVPALALTLISGVVADTYDRRRIMNAAQLVAATSAGTLFWLTKSGSLQLWALYAGVVVISSAWAFEGPARTALLPQIVGAERFQRAVTLASTNQALAFVSGPALGGVLIASFGVVAAYGGFLCLLAVAFFSVLGLRVAPRTDGPKRSVSFAAIAEGLRFVWSRPVVLGCMTLDMFAVIFGGATALLPIYAKEILHVGAQGYGLLTSALEIGALSMALLLMTLPPVRAAGRVLLTAVAVYGVATIVFGASRAFPLSLAAYIAAGAADQVSVVLRSTAATGAPFAVVSGGIACLLVVLIVAWRMPELRRYELASKGDAR